MSDYDLKAESRGDLTIVTELTTGFFAVYTKQPAFGGVWALPKAGRSM